MGMKDVFKVFGICYRIVFSGCRNSVDCTFRIRNHTYIQHQLCVKPEQPFIIRNLYVSDQYAAYSGTVLDHQKK